MAVITYLNSLSAPIAHEILTQRTEHELVRIDAGLPLSENLGVLARAHAWQCVGARDEVPVEYRVDAAFLARAPQLLVVSASGSGVDVFDLEACNAAGVVAVNQAGSNAQSVAEHAIAMMISLLRNIGTADRALRRGWSGARLEFIGNDLRGRTIGIVGLGNIGRRIAQTLRAGFDCQVLAYDPYLSAEQVRERCAEQVGFEELLARADIVTVHTPLTDETRGMLDRAAYARMKPGALFVSTARGSIHDEVALADALASGHIGGAGLDVWEREPPASSHRLLAFDNVIATPHVAGATHDSMRNMASFAATQLLDILDGKPPARPVNPQVLPHFERRRREILGV